MSVVEPVTVNEREQWSVLVVGGMEGSIIWSYNIYDDSTIQGSVTSS